MEFNMTALDIAVTNLGNLAVVGPPAVLVWLWLARRRGLRAAIDYQWPVVTVFIVVVCLKVVSRTSGGAFVGTAFELSHGAPSGHMAMSTVVYGGVALMLLRRGLEPIALIAGLLTLMTLVGVGVTRVILHAHTPADVVTGLFIGGLGAVWVASVLETPSQESTRQVAELVLIMIALVAIMQLSGFRFDSANVI